MRGMLWSEKFKGSDRKEATRRFGRDAGESLTAYLSDIHESADFERVSDWIVDYQSEAEILSKLPANGTADR